ncbi:MAG: hypothetical protein DBX38_03285 [Eubacteriales Family XIII. Incertae Sedis bacterium]|nr:MAG: hypothetical protein DBX38_03285 [Clostridiales Family XIII bacterium]
MRNSVLKQTGLHKHYTLFLLESQRVLIKKHINAINTNTKTKPANFDFLQACFLRSFLRLNIACSPFNTFIFSLSRFFYLDKTTEYLFCG